MFDADGKFELTGDEVAASILPFSNPCYGANVYANSGYSTVMPIGFVHKMEKYIGGNEFEVIVEAKEDYPWLDRDENGFAKIVIRPMEIGSGLVWAAWFYKGH
jgi:hypothetical protein